MLQSCNQLIFGCSLSVKLMRGPMSMVQICRWVAIRQCVFRVSMTAILRDLKAAGYRSADPCRTAPVFQSINTCAHMPLTQIACWLSVSLDLSILLCIARLCFIVDHYGPHACARHESESTRCFLAVPGRLHLIVIYDLQWQGASVWRNSGASAGSIHVRYDGGVPSEGTGGTCQQVQ